MNISQAQPLAVKPATHAIVAGGNNRYPQWMRLATETDQVDPFCCTPAWQIPFHMAFHPNRHLLIRHAKDAHVALAVQPGFGGRPSLDPIESHWNFGCPLLGSGGVELLANVFEDIARESTPQSLVISGVRAGSALAQQVKDTFASRYTGVVRRRNVQCVASLAGGIDGFLSRRPARHRKNLGRDARRATSQGVWFDRQVPRTPEAAHAVYVRMAQVEARSWKGIDRCGMNESPCREFYAYMLEWLSMTSDARVVFAMRDDKDVGFIFGGMAGAVYRGQQFSFDEAVRDLSIGNLLQLEQVQWLCEEQATRYDMGPSRGPSMAYKRYWTETELEMQTWVLAARRVHAAQSMAAPSVSESKVSACA